MPYKDKAKALASSRKAGAKWRAANPEKVRARSLENSAKNSARYANDPAYRNKVKSDARESQIRNKERRASYLREYLARKKLDPVWVDEQRVRSRENSRIRRADPAYRAMIQERKKTRRKLVPVEAVIETYLCEEAKSRGGAALKFIDPGRRGAPDRLVVLPGHPTYYVELKRPHLGVLDAAQERYHERLRAWGQKVFVLWSKEEVDGFFASI
jgi:hypothetical protein